MLSRLQPLVPGHDNSQCYGLVNSDYAASFPVYRYYLLLLRHKFFSISSFKMTPSNEMLVEILNKWGIGKCFCLDFLNTSAHLHKFWSKILEQSFPPWLSIPKHFVAFFIFIWAECTHLLNLLPSRNGSNGFWTLTLYIGSNHVKGKMFGVALLWFKSCTTAVHLTVNDGISTITICMNDLGGQDGTILWVCLTTQKPLILKVVV